MVGSISELLEKVDFVLLETNDGRIHLEQAIPVFKAGKRVFIDKPIAASLEHAIAIFEASKYYIVPVFSASSVRYIKGAMRLPKVSVGKVLRCYVFSHLRSRKLILIFLVRDTWCGGPFTIMGTGGKTRFKNVCS